MTNLKSKQTSNRPSLGDRADQVKQKRTNKGEQWGSRGASEHDQYHKKRLPKSVSVDSCEGGEKGENEKGRSDRPCRDICKRSRHETPPLLVVQPLDGVPGAGGAKPEPASPIKSVRSSGNRKTSAKKRGVKYGIRLVSREVR